MPYKNLKEFIRILEEEGELLRIKEFVNPELEISEITDRFSKTEGGGKALLFENTGTGFPVLTNAMGSERRMALALGVEKIEDIEKRIDSLLKELTEPKTNFFSKLSLLPSLARISNYFPSRQKTKAPCQEIILREPDLSILPVLKTWPFDGGRFFTLPLVFTSDPETGERNMGMYRMQVMGKNKTGMHWHRHKTGANHYEKYKSLGKKMPVAVVLGGDPAITFSATAPLPENLDELLLAGFLREKSVGLTKCLTQDVLVPADSEIVLEGYVDPEEEKVIEGPFGDHTGFYSLEDFYPLFHITCITHRKNAVYPATLVGIPPQEDAWIAKVTERLFLTPIQMTVAPEILDMNIPEFGVAHNLTIVSIRKSYPGQARKVMNALWGAGQMMFNKILLITDNQIDIHNLEEVYTKILESDLSSSLVFSAGPLDVLDHSADFTGYGSKLGIDLTRPLEEEKAVRNNISEKGGMKENSNPFEKLASLVSYNVVTSTADNFICLVSVRKNKDYSLKDYKAKLQNYTCNAHVNIFLLVDENINTGIFREFLWYFLNNLEPERDILRIYPDSSETVLLIDGTSKNREYDEFGRDWPNPVTMDDVTINSIDRNWKEYNIGPLIQSPSLYYKKLIKKPGARAFENPAS